MESTKIKPLDVLSESQLSEIRKKKRSKKYLCSIV